MEEEKQVDFSIDRFSQVHPSFGGYKAIFLGDSCAGKTSLLKRFVDGNYEMHRPTTIGYEYMTCTFNLKNEITPSVNNVHSTKKVKLNIWDTPGELKFRSMPKQFIRDSHIIVICYDLTSKDSFDNIKEWMEVVEQYLQQGEYLLYFCECKSDLENDREVGARDIKQLEKEFSTKVFSTSAKENAGIQAMFTEIMHDVRESSIFVKNRGTFCLSSSSSKSEESPQTYYQILKGSCCST
ncbi:unnamed protein product [Moneuplotes crassus]|uniref:Uncharacterized protein n=1 Tax=Euplotes crassus TaxID=5936 RepID=A0AAD1XUR0_EUPCR|nr:unnamed protein product [Moneuplotes crassus]